MTRPIFVAANDQHVGKTTTTLALLTAFQRKGMNIGYCKPMGQEFVQIGDACVDKDAALFADIMPFDLEPELHSPVLTASGMTARYIERPSEFVDLRPRIEHAGRVLQKRHELVIYEGTGHPGVGSIVGLSNAEIARILGAGVILVLRGGIGYTYDRMAMCKSMFDLAGVPLLGVIINKVVPEKLEKIQYYLSKRLAQDGIEILGFVPFEQELGYPLLSTIIKDLQAELLSKDDNIDCPVEDIIVGSLMDIEKLQPETEYLLVVSVSRLQAALSNLQTIWARQKMRPNLIGVMLSGPKSPDMNELAFFEAHGIPVAKTNYDTYETIVKISHLEVKLNTKAPHKIERAIELFSQHVNLDRICQLVGL
ncbi:MAG: AAA family ATPase [Chitinophagales bacterium]|jgi:BioD-like phosphotransacetylase family protein|nr:AAA family ATPase [Chitinophagales bacterium]